MAIDILASYAVKLIAISSATTPIPQMRSSQVDELQRLDSASESLRLFLYEIKTSNGTWVEGRTRMSIAEIVLPAKEQNGSK